MKQIQDMTLREIEAFCTLYGVPSFTTQIRASYTEALEIMKITKTVHHTCPQCKNPKPKKEPKPHFSLDKESQI